MLVAGQSAQGVEYTLPFTSNSPGLPFTFVRDFVRVFPEGISGGESGVDTQWPEHERI